MRRLLLAVPALAACSGSLGHDDAGSFRIAGTGGERTDAAVSNGGAGVDAGGSTGGAGGSGGSFPGCTSFGGGSPAPIGACDFEGEIRSGFVCYDSRAGMNWTVICCAGQWQQFNSSPDASAGTCPTLQPGDRFACGSTGLTCVAGQSYCYERNDPNTGANLASCEVLCTAGDCTCFCADPLICSFAPPNAVCLSDDCTCAPPRDSNSLPQLGAVHVACTLGRLPTLTCSPTGNTCNSGTGTVSHCEGLGFVAPNSTCTLWQYGVICGSMTYDWCCAG